MQEQAHEQLRRGRADTVYREDIWLTGVESAAYEEEQLRSVVSHRAGLDVVKPTAVVRPVSQHRRLAVAGWGDHRDDTVRGLVQESDNPRPEDRPCAQPCR